MNLFLHELIALTESQKQLHRLVFNVNVIGYQMNLQMNKSTITIVSLLQNVVWLFWLKY